MFYNYCILQVLWTGASDPDHYTGSLRTVDICREAAQGILNLAVPTTRLSNADGGRKPSGWLASRLVYKAEAFLALYPL